MPSADTPSQPVTFSVLIGLVSTEDGGRILETLDALRRQEGAHAYEVVIGDRRNDEISRKIQKEYPEAKLIRCPPRATLPELRAAALERATGRYVVVTEDHCVPAGDWLASIARAFGAAPPGTVAVGGCVENGVHGTAFDWATFLCEYSCFLTPVTEGTTTALPGMNVAYDRATVRTIDGSLLTGGFWETTVHPELLRAGKTLFSTSSIRILHCKKFTFGLFVRQRYLYSRYYAGLRFGRRPMQRMIALAATPILPVLLLHRIYRHVRTRNRLRSEFMSALPLLLIFVAVWAWGEMVGCALGAGDALARIE